MEMHENFNPRSREGSDKMAEYQGAVFTEISIHAPARGATPSACKYANYRKFQSTLPRGERRYFKTFAILEPTFQSTLPRGERLSSKMEEAKRFKFQSTLPRGERQCYVNEYRHQNIISIHAPARGATSQEKESRRSSRKFQSTLPRGERPADSSVGSVQACEDFNPRSREGSDFDLNDRFSGRTYFNPRSREGSDTALQRQKAQPIYFNPRSREGSDRPAWTGCWTATNFNPRSREGSDFNFI